MELGDESHKGGAVQMRDGRERIKRDGGRSEKENGENTECGNQGDEGVGCGDREAGGIEGSDRARHDRGLQSNGKKVAEPMTGRGSGGRRKKGWERRWTGAARRDVEERCRGKMWRRDGEEG